MLYRVFASATFFAAFLTICLPALIQKLPQAGNYVVEDAGRKLVLTLSPHKGGNFTVTGTFTDHDGEWPVKGVLYKKTLNLKATFRKNFSIEGKSIKAEGHVNGHWSAKDGVLVIAFAQKNLVAAPGKDAGNKPKEPRKPEVKKLDLSGKWDITLGYKNQSNSYTMNLSLSGDRLSGSYSFQGGSITGKLDGLTATGTWSNSSKRNSGGFVWTFSADGKSFTGSYTISDSKDESYNWSGRKR